MTKAKRTIALILASLALASAFAACSKKEDEAKKDDAAKTVETEAAKTVDPEAAAQAIVDGGDFEGALDIMNPAAVEVYYPSLPSDTKCAVYVSDSFSDEVAVFTSADLDTLEAIVRTHVEDKIELYKDYAPEQSEKAKTNAVVVRKNGAVALIISNAAEADAKALVEGALG